MTAMAAGLALIPLALSGGDYPNTPEHVRRAGLVSSVWASTVSILPMWPYADAPTTAVE
jgi:hypothetical protein